MAQERLTTGPLLFTIGYEGLSLDAFLDKLRHEGIRQVIDVRENPWSRRPEFLKGNLAAELFDAGIAYDHMEILGCPKRLRDALRHGGSLEDYQQGYRAHLDDHPEALSALAERARACRTAILCMEKRPEDCHRRLVAERLARAGWAIVDL